MQRYGQPDPNCVYGLEQDDNGQWVRYEDVEAGGAEPVAIPEGWKLVLVNEGFGGLMDSLERAHRKGYMPDAITEDYEGFDYRDAAPTPQPQPQPEPVVLFDDRPQNQRIAEAEERMRNPAPLQFEDESAQPEAPAEPSDNPERDEFYRVFNESAKLTGHKPTLYDVWLMARGRMDTSHRTIATPTPVSQRPAELTEPAARTFEQLLKHIPKPSPEERAAQLAASQATESMRGKLLMTEAEPPAEPTDEQVADAVERSFSELHEWPGNDGDVVRAFLKHWPAIKAQGAASELR